MTPEDETGIRARAAVAADDTAIESDDAECCRRCDRNVTWRDGRSPDLLRDLLCDDCALEELEEARADRVTMLAALDAERAKASAVEADIVRWLEVTLKGHPR